MATMQRRSHKALYLLLVVALILIGLAVWNLVVAENNVAPSGGSATAGAPTAGLAPTLALAAGRALAGNASGFRDLQSANQRLDASVATLTNAGTVQAQWAKAQPEVQTILAARTSVMSAAAPIRTIQQAMPGLIQSWDTLASSVAKRGASTAATFAARQPGYALEIQSDLNWLQNGGAGIGATIARQLPDAMQSFMHTTQGLVVGNTQIGLTAMTTPDLAAQLHDIKIASDKLQESFTALTPLIAGLVTAQRANQTLQPILAQMQTTLQAMQPGGAVQASGGTYRVYVAYVLGAIGLALLLLIIWLYVIGGGARRAANSQVAENERNQQAILRLLDELGALADGDLTVQATVSEDITGAIADSINYAVEALRGLVRTINDTAVQVDAAARQTQATATHLAEASKNQSTQITTASTSVAQMAHSIEQVSQNADRSAKVAQQSVQIAHKGGEAVRRTIDGMSNIRETIQETSKRIKRLGESSQEIGDIVELINDIAEQTNILALNAAIQASMAGEAGRGFAVVADEVQRLAERSTNATRQIETLVKTIQTDTNEAVISMEQSTAGVVGGAQLAENAGTSLNEIEKVANNIATLVQSISRSARQQAQTASDMTRIMNVISEITGQTTDGTVATAQSIGKLAALATEMRKSVSGFKLPSSTVSHDTLVVAPRPQLQRDPQGSAA